MAYRLYQLFIVLLALVISFADEIVGGNNVTEEGSKKQYILDPLTGLPIEPPHQTESVSNAVNLVTNAPPVSGGVPPPIVPLPVKDEDLAAMDKIIQVNKLDQQNIPMTINDGRQEELFEGDIIQTPRLRATVDEMKIMEKHGLKAFDAINGGQWPNGIVPFTFAYRFRGKSVVYQAIKQYKKYTCIRFRPRTNRDTNYVEFMHGGGCSSMIGRQGGRQQISLASGCLVVGIAVHEMMHALGFFHEQSRRDRDNYIRINWNNINRAMWYNFQKYRSGRASTLGEPYDKSSVMHYGNYAFSVNGRKAIVSKSKYNEVLGQRRGLSKIDIRQLNKYYQCDTTTTPVPPTGGGQNDSYSFCPDLESWCRKHKWVAKNCQKTCCADFNRNCQSWKEAGYCKGRGYDGWMKTNCAKSCNYC